MELIIIRVNSILENSFYKILCVFVISFLFVSTVFAYDNGTVVAYDNETTVPYDYDNSSVNKKNNYYDYYPVSIGRELDVTNDVNNQLQGSGFIFLPNSPGDVFPIGAAGNKHSTQEGDIQKVEINAQGGE